MTTVTLPGITVTAPRPSGGADTNYGGSGGVNNLVDVVYGGTEDCWTPEECAALGAVDSMASESSAELIATQQSDEDLATLLSEITVVSQKPVADPRIVSLEKLLERVPDWTPAEPAPTVVTSTPSNSLGVARNARAAELRQTKDIAKLRAMAAKGDIGAIRLLEKYFPVLPTVVAKVPLITRLLAPFVTVGRLIAPIARGITSPIVSLFIPTTLAPGTLYSPAQLAQMQKSKTTAPVTPISSTTLLKEVVVTARSSQPWPESSLQKLLVSNLSVPQNTPHTSTPQFETILEPLSRVGLTNTPARQLKPSPSPAKLSRPTVAGSIQSLTSPTNPTYTDPLSPTVPSAKNPSDPLTPPRESTNPLSASSPGGSRCPPCGSKQKDKEKKKKKKRTECYRGTYIEKASGLLKTRKEKIACQ